MVGDDFMPTLLRLVLFDVQVGQNVKDDRISLGTGCLYDFIQGFDKFIVVVSVTENAF
jgi:hypothetical protein